MFQIMIEDCFCAAHQLKGYEGPCENLHGHNFRVQVFLKKNKLNSLGMIFDFKKAKNILRNIIKDFDHKFLNVLPFFKKINPTAENISKVIFHEFSKNIKRDILLEKVIVWESEKACAIYHL